ncbi:hypothetical protein DPMN_105471 [Dreissena polymorpha]|uniref:Uncharacterized protein n=1 Tax=Dreissena polymorpha TaxID=45954 RepID=A0A9D4HBP1_DREPO|nr:hypothetical protein DPMN_105471 [Dreissena polymorpha]
MVRKSGVCLDTGSTKVTLGGGFPINRLRGVLLPTNPSTKGHDLSVWGVILPIEACLGDDVEPVVLIVLRAPTLWLAVSGANSLLSAADQVTPAFL